MNKSCLLTEYCGDRVLYHDIYMFPISIPIYRIKASEIEEFYLWKIFGLYFHL